MSLDNPTAAQPADGAAQADTAWPALKQPDAPGTILSALINLNLLAPSPTNPRTTFDEAGIVELADSIAQHEVLHAILARTRPGSTAGEPLEIVAGERRWRACKLLQAQGRNPHGHSIPTTVRALTDRQVLLIQLEENLRRRDLHPLEEAAHYQRMRNSPTAPMTLQEIAEAAGCSPSYVSRMLTLCDLVPQARDAFQQGKLSRATALQVARLPATDQAEATTHLANWGGEPMGAKAAANFLRDRYMLRLAGAVFEVADAQLVPTAGPCTTCPKRTGANPQLFEDISDADLCTDAACFKAKAQAAREALLASLREQGYTIAGADRSRALCTPDGRALRPGMHKLEDQVPQSLGEPTLTVVKVLEHAKAPPSATTIIDHPSAPWLTYAVATADLEAALRKIKSHRQQIDAAALAKAGKGKAAAPPPAEPPAPAPAPAEPAADARPETKVDPDWKYPDEFGRSNAAPEPSPVAAEVPAELLDFHVPATSAGLYAGHTQKQFVARETARLLCILTAHAIARHLCTPAGRQHQPHLLWSRMIITLGLYGDSHLKLEQLAHLVGAPTAPAGHLQKQLQWMRDLEPGAAARVAYAFLALQPSDGPDAKSPDGYAEFPQHCAALTGIDTEPLEHQAVQLVNARMQIGAMQHGAEPKPARKTARSTKPKKGSDHE